MPDSEFDCEAFLDTLNAPPGISMFRAKGCPGVMRSTWDEDGVETIAKIDGLDDGTLDRGMAGLDVITTIGAVEFQCTVLTDPENFGKHYVSLTKTQLGCNNPGVGDASTDFGVALLFANAGFAGYQTSTYAWPTGTDTSVSHGAAVPGTIYKFTLEAGVWKFYINDSLTRTFAYDSEGDEMRLNIGASWIGCEVTILRFSNTEVF